MLFKLARQSLKQSEFKQFTQLSQNYSRQFSTASHQLNQNYARFREKYNENLKIFREKVEAIESKNKTNLKKPSGTPYHHPYHSDHHPLNFSTVKIAEFFHDFVGPEQVSPHYENFMVARKFALVFTGGFVLLTFAVQSVDLHWIMKSSFIPFFFWMQIMYMYLEGRKSFFKPLLARFYRRIAANEIYNFEVFYHENMQNRLRDQIRIAKSQIEYSQLHDSYHTIKADSINNFMANEHLNLQKNIQDRAVNVLKSAVEFEKRNQDRYIQKIIDDATAEIDIQLKGEKSQDIQKQMLTSAINGISKGFMDYQNDPVLPLVLNKIKTQVQQLNGLSQQEQLKLIALTEQQLKDLRDSDERAKKEFLTSQPAGLDNAVKTNEQVKKILANWGK